MRQHAARGCIVFRHCFVINFTKHEIWVHLARGPRQPLLSLGARCSDVRSAWFRFCHVRLLGCDMDYLSQGIFKHDRDSDSCSSNHVHQTNTMLGLLCLCSQAHDSLRHPFTDEPTLSPVSTCAKSNAPMQSSEGIDRLLTSSWR